MGNEGGGGGGRGGAVAEFKCLRQLEERCGSKEGSGRAGNGGGGG